MTHHLMILDSRYLADIVSGRKTIECRFLRTAKPPFRSVSRGDTLWLKRSGGPVEAFTTVRRVIDLDPVTPEVLENISTDYGSDIRADSGFFTHSGSARYATLIHLGRVETLQPFVIGKRDRRAWVVLEGPPVIRPTSQ